MAEVFFSYARSDKKRVAPLVAAIEAKGWSVWWDPQIDAGAAVRRPDRGGTEGRQGRAGGLDADLDGWGEDAGGRPFQALLRALGAMIARRGVGVSSIAALLRTDS